MRRIVVPGHGFDFAHNVLWLGWRGAFAAGNLRCQRLIFKTVDLRGNLSLPATQRAQPATLAKEDPRFSAALEDLWRLGEFFTETMLLPKAIHLQKVAAFASRRDILRREPPLAGPLLPHGYLHSTQP